MPRKRRIHYAGAVYHVMLRGNGKQTIFYGDEEYQYFENVLAQAMDEYSVRLHAYCWMKNHVHMALQVEDPPLSKLMQKLSQRYTHWFNNRHKRVGHLFQGRYKAILVDSDAYLRELIRYIHLNPVRAKLVQHPAEFPFSSHGAYAGTIQPPPWLTIDFGMAQFGKTHADASAAYFHFMGQISEETLMEQLRHGTKEGRILGDDIFIENVLRQNSEAAPVNITLEELVGTVAYVYQVLPQEICSASRSRHLAEARGVAALVGMDLCGYLLSDFAEYFNRSMPSMSEYVKSIRGRMKTNQSLYEKVEQIKGSGFGY